MSNGTPLVNDLHLIARSYELGQKIASNVKNVLTQGQLEYYERNLGEIPMALARGFVLPQEIRGIGVVSQHLIPVAQTNLALAIKQAEEFSTTFLVGYSIDLRESFTLPTELPWKDVMVVFDPGLTDRQAVDRALKSQKLDVYEEINVMDYSGSEKEGKPTLHIIENSLKPTADTLGDKAKSPDQLVKDGRTYLSLRGYTLAFGLRYHVYKDYLDEETWTWFPKNRLPSGKVARGYWLPDNREVRFRCGGSGGVRGGRGARLTIPVSLNP